MPYLLIILLCISTLEAKDFGCYGATFQIDEDDILEVLMRRLEKMHIDDSKLEGVLKSFINSIECPIGIKLPKAKVYKSFYFDPSLVVNKEILDDDNNVIIPKGTIINPLDCTQLRENLIFIDGDDQKQIDWAKNQKGKWILVSGNPLQLEKKENRPVYFDQGGYLISRLGIQFLPALVSQCEKKLKVEEMLCD